jgi:hypothetical protein
MLVIRATPANRSAAIEEMVERAQLSATVYVVEQANQRQLLYGVSVFAYRQNEDSGGILLRLRAAPMFVEAPVGAIRTAGFEIFATGDSPNHFDVQLIAGVTETEPDRPESEIRDAAVRLLDLAAEMRPNPFYTGYADD